MANATSPNGSDVCMPVLPTEMATNCSSRSNKTLNAGDQTHDLSYSVLVLFTLACITVLVLNMMVICVVLSKKKLRTEASLTYCVSLSAADVTLALTYILNMAVLAMKIQMPLVCTIAKNLVLVCGNLSAGSVTLLVIHRYVSVRLPILHRKWHTMTVSVCLCVTMWILCSLIQFFPYAMQTNKSPYEQCLVGLSYWEELSSVASQIIIVGFSLLALVVLLHVLTFVEVKRLYRKITPKLLRRKTNLIHKSRTGRTTMSQTCHTEIAYATKTTNNSNGQESQTNAIEDLQVKGQLPNTTEPSVQEEIIPDSSISKRDVEKKPSHSDDKREQDIKILTGVSKTAKVTTFLITAMFVFNLPLLVLLALAQFGNEHRLHNPDYSVLRRVVTLLHFMNALVNPIIYAGNQEQIRKYVTQTVSRWNCRQTQSNVQA